ncbi:two-component response regulator arr14 [Phtheirospermum japonicum]|uniref:Two-component response regulator arr14 n=1 Tax=Phtheirospermum japonicum TaxID=374723 RepID=A0A830D872_9LAMI|nr:two-component response regulator arr14 [Phtheirospermum japonicum]
MRSSILPELSLDCRFPSKACSRKSIGEIFAQVSRNHGVSEKILKLQDHVNRLRDEMKKIDAFKRELPLCMLLLNDAIVAAEEELAQHKKSNAEPVLEEFIPLKKSCKDEQIDRVEVDSTKKDISCRDKMNWMSSVQLWNSDSDLNNKLTLKLDNNKKRAAEEEVKQPAKDNVFQSIKNRTVVPLKGCMNFPVKRDELLPVPALSLCTPELKDPRDMINSIGFSPNPPCSSSRSGSSSATPSNFKTIQHQNSRKQRRCWSPELHRQFINALQQLGGAQAATPKQIRELMQVDGLTNDEVKSHLQKYRLHSRRNSANSNSQSIGLWMAQEQCNESSGSPEGPLQLDGSPEGNCGGNEDEDDEGHNWKGDIGLSGRDDV